MQPSLSYIVIEILNYTRIRKLVVDTAIYQLDLKWKLYDGIDLKRFITSELELQVPGLPLYCQIITGIDL